MYRINKNKRTRFKCYFDGFAEAIKDNSSRDINNRDINLFMSLIQARKYLKIEKCKFIFKEIEMINIDQILCTM